MLKNHPILLLPEAKITILAKLEKMSCKLWQQVKAILYQFSHIKA